MKKEVWVVGSTGVVVAVCSAYVGDSLCSVIGYVRDDLGMGLLCGRF